MRGGWTPNYPQCRDIRRELGGENPARWLHFGLNDMVVAHLDDMARADDLSRARAWYDIADEHFSDNRPLVSVCWQVFEAVRDGRDVRVVVREETVKVVEVGTDADESESKSVTPTATDATKAVADGGTETATEADTDDNDGAEVDDTEFVTVAIGDLPDSNRDYRDGAALQREADDIVGNIEALGISDAECRERLLEEYCKGTERQPHIIKALKQHLNGSDVDGPGNDVEIKVAVENLGDQEAAVEGGCENRDEEAVVDTETDEHDSENLLMGAMG